MIPILVSAHALTSILTIAFMQEMGADDDVTYLVILAVNGAQMLFEALTVRGGYHETLYRKKRPGR